MSYPVTQYDIDVTLSAGFSGRPYDLRLRIWTETFDAGTNQHLFLATGYVYSRSGYGSYHGDSTTWNVDITLTTWEDKPHHWDGARGLDFRPDYAGKTIQFLETGAFNIEGPNADNGEWHLTARAYWNVGSPFGSADTGTQMIGLPRIPEAPGQSAAPTFSSITSFSALMNVKDAYRGHSDILHHEWQLSKTSNFSSIVSSGTVPQSNRNATLSGLTANTGYFARSRPVSNDGTGPWSPNGTLTTSAPSVPVPSAPRNLRITNKVPDPSDPANRTLVTMAWDAPASGAPFTGFDWSYGNGAAGDTGSVGGSTFSATMSINTAWGTSVTCTVRAVNAGGAGPYAASVAPFAPDPVPGVTGFPKVRLGSSFTKKPIKAFMPTGVWAQKPLKRYDGSTWVKV